MSGEIAEAVRYAARHLGTGTSATTMGALEYVGSTIRDAGNAIAAPIGRAVDVFSEFENTVGHGVDNVGRVADAIVDLAAAVRERGAR